jgi:DNA-binding NarL/FixJ family response regulator
MRKRILIVDDHPLNLIGLSRALKVLCKFNGVVRTVDNGSEAIQEFCLHFYHICFLDIKLPDMSGLDVMKKIHEISPETDIVIISACSLYADMQKAIEEKASIYFPKPYDIVEIDLFLKQALEGDREFYGELIDSGVMMLKEGKRKYRRRPLTKPVEFFLKHHDNGNGKGNIIDISHSGIGMQLHYPLEEGCLLFFDGGIAHKKGIVRWSDRLGHNNYRAGIYFV